MALLKHPYELSVWDILPEEKKMAIIGSDTMTSPIRAIDPILVRNVNGTVTLTFKMYTHYFDEDKEQITENPFLSMLMVERTLKLKYKDKWYDLVIKNRQESSDQKMYSYTAKSAHICELSKIGFDLEFKTELQNNQGTITELGEKIMEGTDWEIGSSDIIRAYQDDQLVLCQSDDDNVSGEEMITKTSQGFNEGKQFYAFYSDYKAFIEEHKDLQVLKINYESLASGKNLDDWILDAQAYDDNGILTTGTNVLLKYSDALSGLISKIGISNYRGRRLVKKQKTKFNATLDRYVDIYTSGEKNEDGSFKEDVEGYSKTEFLSPNFVENLIVNSKDFESTAGWYGKIENKKDDKGNTIQCQPTVELDYFPPISQETDWEKVAVTGRIKITPKATDIGNKVYNTGLRSNFSKIEDFAAGEQLLLCYNFVNENNEVLGKNELTDANVTFSIDGFRTSSFGKNDEIGEIERKDIPKQIFTAIDKVTKEDLKKAQFTITFNEAGPYYLKDISLFRYVKGDVTIITENEDGTKNENKYEDIIIYPGDVPDNKSIVTNFYYNVEENANNKAEEYAYLNSDETYTPIYNDANYEKIASIEKSESNRFNLIQELCETFECWADFVIEHDSNGKVLSKTIYFKEYIGENRYTGFKYGINLKSIQRTIDSEQIATKIIVKPNSNEHGENGFCTIARATENPLGGTYLLNFDYYVNQGLLKKEDLDNDLYTKFIFLDKDGNEKYDKGFYDLMYEKSRRRDEIIAERTAFSASYLEGIAAKGVADETLQATEQLLSDLKQQYKQYSGVEWPNISLKHREGEEADGKIADNEIYKFITKIQQAQSMRDDAEADATKYEDYTEENHEAKLKSYNERVQELKIEELEDDFFNKYHNFIQEGTWNSEEYWDDNEYYIDALDVVRTSSRPKVTYTINVIDVSVLDDYEGYEFDVGDKTFMEDPEFFGYVFYEKDGDSYKKPYKEEVVITEISEHLEAPESNQIKVQNYKTQFDDLFQRITAQTQSLQYASGGYNRASAAINSDGTIDGELLQNSLLNYALALMNPENKGVIWDRDGIRIIDRENTNKILKLTGGALQISNDGGNTWAIAVNGNGINAGLVTTGSINTEEIMIGNSENFSFRWDASGLNAYTKNDDESYNYGKFVRFDQYGLYGYSKGTVFNPNNLSEVKNNADFGLTWEGFFLKSKAREGWIEIDSENDFRVLIGTPDNYKEKIKIGEISKGVFGITIKDTAGNDAFYTDDNGDLTLIGHIEAGSGKIGNWEIADGMLTSVGAVNEYGNQGIYLDAINSEIYSAQYKESTGSDGWMINNDQAVFNNITLRGALKCAVLEYGEVQAVGGILMVRPSTTIKEFAFFKTIQDDEGNPIEFASRYPYYATGKEDDEIEIERKDDFIEFEVENALYFNTNDWVKIASEAGSTDFLKEIEESEVSLYSGINTNLLKCLGVFYKNKILRIPILDEEGNVVLDEEGNETFDEKEVRVPVVLLSLTDIPYQTDEEGNDQLDASGTSIFGLMSLPLKGMGLVNLGNPSTKEDGVSKYDGAIGISLNSSTNNVMVPETSFSMFTLEERSSTINGNRTWKYLKPHIVLGKIPNESIYGEVAGQYGLYADAVEITGAIHATSISTVDTSGKRTEIPFEGGKFSQEAISGLTGKLDGLQKQIDGVIDTWYYAGVPTLDNEPAKNWTTLEEKQKHEGDLYYDTNTSYSYRFMKNGDAYTWGQLADNEITAALKELSETKDALDNKVSTFMEQEGVAVPPDVVPVSANEGDLLFSNDSKIYVLNSSRKWVLKVEPVTPTKENHEYAQTNSGTEMPSSWSPTRPALEQGKYLWTKTTITYSDGKSKSESYTVAYQGSDGISTKSISISGEQIFKLENSNYTPNFINLTASLQGALTFKEWQYKTDTGYSSFGATNSNLQVDPNNPTYFVGDIATFKAIAQDSDKNNYEDIFSLYKIKDGEEGAPGDDAYTIILSNENHTFTANKSGKITTDQSTTCAITAYKGATPQSVTIEKIEGAINGITTSISNNGTTNASITINATADDTPSTSGTLTITLKIDGKSFSKTFSYSVVKQGATGASITSVTTQYATVTKGASAPAESSDSWEDISPTSYNSSNDYYYRYKQIYSNGNIKYTSPSNWFNPYSVRNGAVLEFDSNGYVTREVLKGLTWSYVDSQNTMTMPSSPDHTRGEDKPFVIVQFEESGNKYVLSYDNLAVHTNILAEGTIIASNGLIGDWQIFSGSLMGGGGKIFLRPDSEADENTTGGLITAGAVSLGSGNYQYNFRVLQDGTLLCGYDTTNSKYNFKVDGSNGNVEVKGAITATSLTIQSGATVSGLDNENLLIVSDPNIFGSMTPSDIREEVKKYWIIAGSQDVVGTKTTSILGKTEMLTIELNTEKTEYDFGLNYLGEDSYVFVNTARADVLPNTKYTISFEGFLGDNGDSCKICAYYSEKGRKELSYTDNSWDLGSTGYIELLKSEDQNKWKRVTYTFTTPKNCHSVWFRIRLTPTIASNICSMWFKKLKLEKGDVTTPYTPSPYDPLFQDALLSNGRVLRTDGSGKLLDSFAPKVNISGIEGDSNNVNVTFDGDSIPYKVPKNGLIVADNIVTKGTVISSQGVIGGWTIGDKAIYNGTSSFESTINGTYVGTDGIKNLYGTSRVSIYDGMLFANNAYITGEIVATTLDLTNTTVVGQPWVDKTLYDITLSAFESVTNYLANEDGKYSNLLINSGLPIIEGEGNEAVAPYILGNPKIVEVMDGNAGDGFYIEKAGTHGPCFSCQTKNTAENAEVFIYTSRAINIQPDTTYTISFEVRPSGTFKSMEIFWLSTNDINASGTSFSSQVKSERYEISTEGGGYSLKKDEWQTVSWTFTTQTDDVSGFIRIDNNGSNSSIENSKLRVRNIKLEKGEFPTTYTPSVFDRLNGGSVLMTDSVGRIFGDMPQGATITKDIATTTITMNGTSYTASNKGLVIASNAFISGTIIASQGIIGGWTIDGTSLTYSSGSYEYCLSPMGKEGTINGTNGNFVFYAKSGSGEFGVGLSGKLFASNAKISGDITATSGKISNWNIGNFTSSYKNVLYAEPVSDGTYAYALMLRNSGKEGNIAIGVKRTTLNEDGTIPNRETASNWNNENAPWIFSIKQNGTLYAQKAEIEGTIKATNGKFGNLAIKTLEQDNGFTTTILGTDYNSSGNVILVQPDVWLCPDGYYYKDFVTYGEATYDIDAYFLASENYLDSSSSSVIIGSLIGDQDNSSYIYSDMFQGNTILLRDGLLAVNVVVQNFAATGEFIISDKLQIDTKIRGYVHLDLIKNTNGLQLVYPDDNSPYGAIAFKANSVNVAKIGVTMESNQPVLTLDSRSSSGSSSGGKGRLLGTWYQGTGSTLISSDLNVKNSIEILSEKYSILFDNLQPIRYKYNNGTSDRYHSGFIAQQVEEAINLASLTNQEFAGFARTLETETDPTTGEEVQVERCYLRYEEFIALNTNEIQKLKKRVTELETKLAELLNQRN